MFRKRLMAGLTVVMPLIFLMMALAQPGIGKTPDDRHLTILFTHDLHSHIDPFKTVTADGSVARRGGYDRLAAAIAAEMAKNPGRVLVVDGGDFSMGTLFHTLFTSEAAELGLMGEMGYDATTFGNHEFDFDSSGLASMLAAARERDRPLPSVVSSNIGFRQNQEGESGLKEAMENFPVRDYTVVEKGGLRIGIFGLLGNDAAHDIIFGNDIEVRDPVKEAARVVKILREQEKVDLVVCLSHSGTSQTGSNSEDEILAGKVPGIDVIISGHTHTLLTQPIIKGGTIIASAGCYGDHLGILELNCPPGGHPEMAAYRLEEIVPGLPGLPDISAEIENYRKLVNQRFLAPYGYTYNQVLAGSQYNMESLVSMDANPVEAGLGDLITDSFRASVEKAEGGKGDYLYAAVQPLGEIRGSFTAGPVTVDDVFQVLSLGMGMDNAAGYPLVSFYLTGREIKNCLETQTSVAPAKSNYNLQVSGVRFLYNPHRVPFDRIYQAEISSPAGGYEPLQPDKLYRVCTSYMTAVMLGKMGSITRGIIAVTPRDRSGNPISDMKEALIDADPDTPGIQELKEWQCLASYLRQQPDLDGDSIPDLPLRYSQPEGRYKATPSWNPVNLFRNATYITWGFLGITALAIGIALLAARWIRRLIKKRIIQQSRPAGS
ncbi:MAG: bifunctional metallophosphatase/5'-nucleotidase [Bacillota bacterium]